MSFVATWKARVTALKRETYTLYLATCDPRVPWLARVVAASTVAYVFSPIDLIPDFIPVFGYLDDLILVPLGIALAIRLIPPAVLADCRARADEIIVRDKPISRTAAVVIISIWLLVLLALVLGILRMKWY